MIVLFPSKPAFTLVLRIHVLGVRCCVRGRVPFPLTLFVLFTILPHLEGLRLWVYKFIFKDWRKMWCFYGFVVAHHFVSLFSPNFLNSLHSKIIIPIKNLYIHVIMILQYILCPFRIIRVFSRLLHNPLTIILFTILNELFKA